MASKLVKLVGAYVNFLSYFSKSYAANKALELFSKPRKGKITEIQSDFLDTAFKERLKYGAYQIMTYRWLGDKQTILLAHGWESNSGRWNYIISSLKNKGFNLIALDAPAHGNSGSTSFNAILYSEFINIAVKKFKPNHIIAHSIGGMASVFFQYKYQVQSIEKLVLLGAPSNFKDILKRYTDMLGYNERVIEQLNTIILERFGAVPEYFSTAKFLESIDSKGLIIHDEHDKIIPYNDAILIKNSFKNSTLITTQGLGHSLNDKIVTSHISQFIDV